MNVLHPLSKACLIICFVLCPFFAKGQINTDRVLAIGRNALYFEDYVLSMQYFNQVIRVKPYLADPYFLRGIAKYNLDDFAGAEEDCSKALDINPFLTDAWQCRALSRQQQNKFQEAVDDYTQALTFDPYNKGLVLNRGIAYQQMKDTISAEKEFSHLIETFPRYALGYINRSNLYLETNDTVKALADISQALTLDKYNPQAYASRAMIYYKTEQFKEAVTDLNEAIRLEPNQPGFYINRGLAKYGINDLRGMMKDYDRVIEMDPSYILAYFNRGLLRAQVGDDNRAISDFDKVIDAEPDNYIAVYNRALLRDATGNYKGAIKDYTAVINAYPDFFPCYHARSEAKRKIREMKSAEADYLTAIQIEERLKREKASGSKKHPKGSTNKTRKISNKNIEEYNKIAEADTQEESSRYQNPIRGRVQNKNKAIDAENLFVLSYYERPQTVNRMIHYHPLLNEFNSSRPYQQRLILTNNEASLDSFQILRNFSLIDENSTRIASNGQNGYSYFMRAISFGIIQDYGAALQDYNKVIALNPKFILGWFNRGAIRFKEMLTRQTSTDQEESLLSGLETLSGKTEKDVLNAYDLTMKDFTTAINLDPTFIYAWFNRGNLKCTRKDYRGAIADYRTATDIEPQFAEAWFNLGLVYIQTGELTKAVLSLSKAGELGIVSAYNIIKRVQKDQITENE